MYRRIDPLLVVRFECHIVCATVIAAFSLKVVGLTFDDALIKRSIRIPGASVHVRKVMRSLMPDGRYFRSEIASRALEAQHCRYLCIHTINAVLIVSDGCV